MAKRIRCNRHLRAILRCHRQPAALTETLRSIFTDTARDWRERSAAGKLLALVDQGWVDNFLMTEFRSREQQAGYWDTALVIQTTASRTVVTTLTAALHDANPDRRLAAAQALGWLRPPTPRAAKALIAVLLDPSQPQPVREQACESLGYIGYRPSIPALVSVLDEAAVGIRFWAVFGLGSAAPFLRHDQGVGLLARQALERMLSDPEVAPGNYWSVGKEALGMLSCMGDEYVDRVIAETERVLADPAASPEDRRWAECYDRSPRMMSSRDSRSRTTRQDDPSTSTSAGRGREL